MATSGLDIVLGKLLLKQGLLDQTQLDGLTALQAADPSMTLPGLLVDAGIVTQAQLDMLVAQAQQFLARQQANAPARVPTATIPAAPAGAPQRTQTGNVAVMPAGTPAPQPAPVGAPVRTQTGNVAVMPAPPSPAARTGNTNVGPAPARTPTNPAHPA
ncbi:MAG: hypothetical protein AB2A00_23750, partial [Myxococcota bacterium]